MSFVFWRLFCVVGCGGVIQDKTNKITLTQSPISSWKRIGGPLEVNSVASFPSGGSVASRVSNLSSPNTRPGASISSMESQISRAVQTQIGSLKNELTNEVKEQVQQMQQMIQL